MKKVIKTVINVSFLIYLLALIYILFLRFRVDRMQGLDFSTYVMSSTNLVPFRTINTYIQAMIDGSMNMYIPIENLAGNLLLFLPMGVFLPYYIARINKISQFISSMIVLLFVVEAMQFITRRGSFDIDDFILNMIGALIGYGIWKMKLTQKLLRYVSLKGDKYVA